MRRASWTRVSLCLSPGVKPQKPGERMALSLLSLSTLSSDNKQPELGHEPYSCFMNGRKLGGAARVTGRGSRETLSDPIPTSSPGPAVALPLFSTGPAAPNQAGVGLGLEGGRDGNPLGPHLVLSLHQAIEEVQNPRHQVSSALASLSAFPPTLPSSTPTSRCALGCRKGHGLDQPMMGSLSGSPC